MGSRNAILMIGPLPPPVGGMATFVKNLLDSRITQSADVRLLNTALSSRAQNSPWVRTWATVRFLRELVERLLHQDIRIAHILVASSFWGFWEKGVMLLVCRGFRSRVILHIHGGGLLDWYPRSWAFVRQLVRATLGASDRVIVTSEYWSRHLGHIVHRSKISVVPNGVNLDDFPTEHPGKVGATTNILFVGTINQKKGLYDILEALKILKARGVDSFSCQIMGREVKTGEQKRIQSLYEKAGLEEAVFLGAKEGEEKNRYFREADVFVLPSYVEATPMALLEAMAAGLPVVATRVGAIPELIQDGENGLLVEPGDYRSLAQKIRVLFDDPDLRRQMGARNRRRVQAQYGVKTTRERTLAVYRELCRPA